MKCTSCGRETDTTRLGLCIDCAWRESEERFQTRSTRRSGERAYLSIALVVLTLILWGTLRAFRILG